MKSKTIYSNTDRGPIYGTVPRSTRSEPGNQMGELPNIYYSYLVINLFFTIYKIFYSTSRHQPCVLDTIVTYETDNHM